MSVISRHNWVFALLLAGCAAGPSAKTLEEAAPQADGADGKLDSFQRPTDHGAIAPGATATATLTPTAWHHTWDFSLSGAAEVELSTGPATAHGRELDTVVYLYKERATGGWGSYVARNDDRDGTLWSKLTRALTAGRYRVLVKGYAASTRGAFAVTAGCTGAGCSAPAGACLLGTTYHELLGSPDFAHVRSERLTSGATLTAIEQTEVIAAIHESSHTDVTTVEEAFLRADQGEINLTELDHTQTGTHLIAFEYGAGDNSYGAVFFRGTGDRAAAIHDGDLYSCVFTAASP